VGFENVRATVETYCLGIHWSEGEEGPMTRVIPVRYVDRFEGRHGDWKISQRVAVCERAFESKDVEAAFLGHGSVRDHTDPAYG
jgi:hypothetical protein